ncbi:ABC transporter substrate-binding protein [Microbacterium oleivorans]|uniref:Sugar ABC transporter substrate-binding protein n=1 Tax=Microbacterium oleivorans TaxID=273677 RepID=A0A7D5F4F9_9MICO|nr:sugar ABC transporter substrate-binding protein [Microbacterium oleivorans]QLD11207.1 sugar ABC transporter substrate-binding protein [Microbacterium oleivorans]
MRSRKLATTTVAGIIALALAGCAGGDAGADASTDDVVTLDWWTWWGNAEAYADAWNAENPNIQIKVSNVGIGEEQTAKLLAAVRAGEGPDLALAEYQTLPSYVVSGIAEDITQYVSDAEDRFTEPVWNLTTLEGTTYGVPVDLGPMMLFYRPDLFEQFGIDVPETWAEYRTAAETVKAQDPSVFMNVFSPIDAGKFAGLAQQAGAEWWTVEDGTWSVDINDDASKKVADYWQGLVDSELVSAQPWWTPEFYKLVADGKVLSFPAGAWLGGSNFVTNIGPEQAGLWRAAPLPVWDEGDPTGYMGSSTIVVTTTSEHPEQAAEFVKWLGATSEGNAELHDVGAPIASLAGLEEYADEPGPDGSIVQGQEEYYGLLATVLENTASVTYGPNSVATFTAYRDEIGRALRDGSSFADALDAVQQATVDDLEASGFTVN